MVASGVWKQYHQNHSIVKIKSDVTDAHSHTNYPIYFYSDANLRMRIVSHLRGEEEEEDITEKT